MSQENAMSNESTEKKFVEDETGAVITAKAAKADAEYVEERVGPESWREQK